MNDSAPTDQRGPPPTAFRDRAGGIVATATILGLLYVGRDVLMPVTLAVILSLLIAPLVRALRRVGFGQTLSVLAAVLLLAAAFSALAMVIGLQLVRMTQSLPNYENTIRRKVVVFNELTLERLNTLTGQAGRFIEPRGSPTAAPTGSRPAAPQPAAPQPAAPLPVVIRDPPPDSIQVLKRVLSSVWVPLESAGVVFIVLIFVLLEREALRDRFIRIAGGTDIRASTLALNDAGERLSRFFVSQFLVNLGVGAAIGAGLWMVGLPHALLWGALACVLRFVPYIGVWMAALLATLMAAAVDPGWTLALATLGLFTVIELVAGQLIEPQLFGHTTGLSPLSVVLAAIFWSWLWGPTGLIVSTPLTLCLVVAGRHIKALSLLDVLLGDAQALTMPQRFYQRALSGDSDEIIANARAFLKRNSFASYCDMVLVPALALARLDFGTGAINAQQQNAVREVIVSVIGALGGESRRVRRRRHRGGSVLDPSSAGRVLRSQRELLYGPFQGPLVVPPGSVMLCLGLGTVADELATELLVRVMRDQKIDARHLSLDDFNKPAPPEAKLSDIAAVYLVSAFPCDERARADHAAERIRERLPQAVLVTVFLPGILLQPGPSIDSIRTADRAAATFGQAVQIGLELQQQGTHQSSRVASEAGMQ